MLLSSPSGRERYQLPISEPTTLATDYALAGLSGGGCSRRPADNDLMHVVQMLAVWLLYRGGSGLYDAFERG